MNNREVDRSEAVVYLRFRGMSDCQANQWYDWYIMYNKKKPTSNVVYQTAFMVNR